MFNCHEQHFSSHCEAFLLGTAPWEDTSFLNVLGEVEPKKLMAPCYIIFLRFIGEDIDAKKFKYVLEVGSSGRTLTWKGLPRSIRKPYEKVRQEVDGLVIPHDLAVMFSEGNQQEGGVKFNVKGRIWLQEEEEV